MLNCSQVESLVNVIANKADIFEDVTGEFKSDLIDDLHAIVEHWNEEQKLTTDRIIWSLNFEDVLATLEQDVEYFENLSNENVNWFHDLPKQIQRNVIHKYTPVIEKMLHFHDWMDVLSDVLSYTDLSLELSKDIDYHKSKEEI